MLTETIYSIHGDNVVHLHIVIKSVWLDSYKIISIYFDALERCSEKNEVNSSILQKNRGGVTSMNVNAPLH